MAHFASACATGMEFGISDPNGRELNSMNFDSNSPPANALVPFTVERLEAFVLRWPARRPVQTSFGTMHDRPAVLVRVEGKDGGV